ncbi:MAG TPA: hypothetical protein VD833_07095 [Vicinamibacterales bacterium]|nr:hypothetical protein [Vicinamibacterales bacterium]
MDQGSGGKGAPDRTAAPTEQRESTEPYADMRLIPGGAAGAPAEIGMSAMHEEDVPMDLHRGNPDKEGR